MVIAAALMLLLTACDLRPVAEQPAVPDGPDVADEPEVPPGDEPDDGGAEPVPDEDPVGDEDAEEEEPPPKPVPGGAFVETFDGNPSAPTPWSGEGWDVAVHSRDVDTWHQLEAVDAQHGPDCGAPPATHRITAYEDMVFSCKDHVMTSINASGYGAIYLTPNRMVDFSDGEAVVTIDVSTLRGSLRDWWDIWLTPYEENLQTPLEDWYPDLAGPPRNAVQVTLNDDNSAIPRIYRNHKETVLESEWWTSYDSFLKPDPARRDTFELRISRTHIRFGMPQYDQWWVDTKIKDLGWDRAVVQLGHHSYTPRKDGAGKPNTWHWDNLTIDPAVPFTMIKADRRYVDPSSPDTVTFDAPAPADANLRFSAMGEDVQVSFDGRTWEDAAKPPQSIDNGLLFSSYWTPVPEGTQQVQVRARAGWLPSWIAKDFAIWSQTVVAGAAADQVSSADLTRVVAEERRIDYFCSIV